MRPSIRCCLAVFCSCLTFNALIGCVSYEAKKVSAPEGTSLGSEFFANTGAVEFRCYSLANPDASRLYLGIDPASTDMVPVMLKVANNGSSPIKLELHDCLLKSIPGGETFGALTLKYACERARRSDVAPVLGAILVFGVAGAFVSGNQVAETNRTLEEDYYRKSFKPALINSQCEGQGIIFFDVPKQKQGLLQTLVIVTTDLNSMQRTETVIDLQR